MSAEAVEGCSEMMKVLVILVIILLLFGVVMYWLYASVFCHPLKKRLDAHRIPESSAYKAHRDKMLEAVEDMEKTPFEEVSILSFDGCKLYGKLYSWKEAAPLVLFFHGYHGVYAWDGYGFFNLCKRNGINILMVEERAHGKSEEKVITFGIKERFDCKLWAEYAAKRFGRDTDLFLAGVSMGAATVMMVTELGLPENVRGVVEDCGYTEPAAIIKETIRKMKLPARLIYPFVKLGAKVFGHFDLEEASALEAVQKLQIPILLIHGTRDDVVPEYMCETLYEHCAGKKEKLLVEGAYHANSALTDYEGYEKAVLGFMKGCLK